MRKSSVWDGRKSSHYASIPKGFRISSFFSSSGKLPVWLYGNLRIFRGLLVNVLQIIPRCLPYPSNNCLNRHIWLVQEVCALQNYPRWSCMWENAIDSQCSDQMRFHSRVHDHSENRDFVSSLAWTEWASRIRITRPTCTQVKVGTIIEHPDQAEQLFFLLKLHNSLTCLPPDGMKLAERSRPLGQSRQEAQSVKTVAYFASRWMIAFKEFVSWKKIYQLGNSNV